MRVICHGKTYRFTCDTCGCVFRAAQKECVLVKGQIYREGDRLVQDVALHCQCPDCGALVRGETNRTEQTTD